MGWLSKLAVVLSQLPVQFLCFKGWLSRLDLQFTYLLLQQFKILCELLCIRSFAFDIFFPASVFCIELIAAKLVAPIGNAKCVRIWKDKYKNSIRKKLEHIRAMNVKVKKKRILIARPCRRKCRYKVIQASAWCTRNCFALIAARQRTIQPKTYKI